jgi:hypothetical protein
LNRSSFKRSMFITNGAQCILAELTKIGYVSRETSSKTKSFKFILFNSSTPDAAKRLGNKRRRRRRRRMRRR